MNKELEALNRMVSFDKKCEFIPQQLKDDFQLIEQALKRNEPIKLKTNNVQVSIDGYRIDYYCPTCDEELYTTSNYCPHCGQKLDWSTEK